MKNSPSNLIIILRVIYKNIISISCYIIILSFFAAIYYGGFNLIHFILTLVAFFYITAGIVLKMRNKHK